VEGSSSDGQDINCLGCHCQGFLCLGMRLDPCSGLGVTILAPLHGQLDET